jgi:hypothetical protein
VVSVTDRRLSLVAYSSTCAPHSREARTKAKSGKRSLSMARPPQSAYGYAWGIALVSPAQPSFLRSVIPRTRCFRNCLGLTFNGRALWLKKSISARRVFLWAPFA